MQIRCVSPVCWWLLRTTGRWIKGGEWHYLMYPLSEAIVIIIIITITSLTLSEVIVIIIIITIISLVTNNYLTFRHYYSYGCSTSIIQWLTASMLRDITNLSMDSPNNQSIYLYGPARHLLNVEHVWIVAVPRGMYTLTRPMIDPSLLINTYCSTWRNHIA